MATRRLVVEIVGDASSLHRSFTQASRSSKTFGRDLSHVTRGTLAGSGALRALGRSLAFASGGFLAFATLAGAIRGSFDELNESRRVTAQTNAVLASTGRIAGVTAKHVDALGQALMRQAGIDDEAIRKGENLLLTFTNIRNVAGANNDIFDQATRATLDMSVAMGTDLNNAAIRVGKALQDPVKGATALRRVGVMLTEQQTKQIEAMVKAGDVIGAQKIVLAELRREFGVSAKAAGDVQPWNRLRETLRNLGADMARLLLPGTIRISDRMQAWLDNTENRRTVLSKFKGIIDGLGTAAGIAADWIGGLAMVIRRVVDAFGGWKNAIAIAIGAFAGFKVAGIASAVAVQTANIVAAGFVATAWKAALISTGIGALAVAAGIAAAYIITHWKKVKTFFVNLAHEILNAFKYLWYSLKAAALRTALAVVEPFSHLPGFLGGWARKAKNAMQSELDKLRPPNMAWGQQAKSEGERTAEAWKQGFRIGVGGDFFPRRWFPRDRNKEDAAGKRDQGAAPPTSGASAAQTSVRKGFELPFRLQLAEAKAEATKTMRDDLQVARQIRAYLLKIIPTLHGQKLLDAYRLLAQANNTLTGQVKEAAKKAQSWAEPLKLQLALAKAEALGKPTEAILRKMRDAARKALASGKLGLQGQIDAWNEIKNINDQLAGQAKTELTKFRHAGMRAVLSGLDLTRDQQTALGFRIAQRGPGGSIPGYNSPAFAASGPQGGTYVINGGLHLHGVQNPRDLEEQLQRRAKQRPRSRRR